MVDDAMTGSFRINLPKDLLSEAERRGGKPEGGAFHVEGWRSSWLSRLTEALFKED
jgi:hypothetical protein